MQKRYFRIWHPNIIYILSNGFRELQSRKMRSSGIDTYFNKILSEDLG